MVSLKKLSALFLSTVAITALAACATGDPVGPPDNSNGSQPTNPYGVPTNILDSGEMLIGVNLTTVGKSYLDENGKISGVDVALCQEIADRFGVEPKWEDMAVDVAVASAQAGRVDMHCPGFTITDKRREEVIMIPTRHIVNSIAVQPDNVDLVNSPTDLCGQTLGSTLGGNTHEQALKWSEECEAQGLPTIEIMTYSEVSDVFAFLAQGRTFAAVQNDDSVSYFARLQPDQIVKAYVHEVDTEQGFILNKNNTQLAEAIVAVFAEMDSDGTLDKIYDDWGVPAELRITDFSF